MLNVLIKNEVILNKWCEKRINRRFIFKISGQLMINMKHWLSKVLILKEVEIC